MIEYGTRLPQHPLDELLQLTGLVDWQYTVFHNQVPLDARPCRGPGTYKVEVIRYDGTAAAAVRHLNGQVTFEGKLHG